MRLPVFDGHNDVVLRIDEGRDFFQESAEGHLDLPRARRGGFAGGLFAVFIAGAKLEEPAEEPQGAYSLPLSPPVDYEEARARTEHLTGILSELESRGAFRIVRSADDVEAAIADGTMAAVLHFEGAEAIGNLNELESWYARGLRSLGLVWSRANKYAEGVPFRFPASPDTGPGLTDAGRELVRACNRLGVLVDLSHLNLRGFFDVAELSDAPLVASHSNAHALCPSTRNLVDEQLDAIADSGGLVGVNFAVSFLREDGQLERDTPLDIVVQHVDYLVRRTSIDHVALGSDFDGAAPPDELRDVTGLPALFEALRGRGYDDEALTKIAHRNWLRVLRETWTR
jgi:membrane dipeptidase